MNGIWKFSLIKNLQTIKYEISKHVPFYLEEDNANAFIQLLDWF